MKLSYRYRALLGPLLLLAASQGEAATFTFDFSATDGSTGSGDFTLNDALAPGIEFFEFSPFPSANLLDFNLTVAGGSVPGGSQTWDIGDLSFFVCDSTFDCLVDFNFSVNNGVASLEAINFNEQNASWIVGAGDETTIGNIQPAAAVPEPTMAWAALLSGLLGAGSLRRRRRQGGVKAVGGNALPA